MATTNPTFSFGTSKPAFSTPSTTFPFVQQPAKPQAALPSFNYLNFTQRQLTPLELQTLANKGWTEWMNGKSFAVVTAKNGKRPGVHYLYGGGEKFCTYLDQPILFSTFQERLQKAVVQDAVKESELQTIAMYLFEKIGDPAEYQAWLQAKQAEQQAQGQ
jgi:hypothetical protein